MAEELKVIEHAGIKLIKQVELYTKWRPLLPFYVHDDTCPRPSNDIMKKVKDDRAAKVAKKKKGKRPQENAPEENNVLVVREVVRDVVWKTEEVTEAIL